MQCFLSISLQWSRYNIELSQLENSEIVLRIYTCLQILEGPVQFLDCSRYLLLSNCSLLWIWVFFVVLVVLFFYCLIRSIFARLYLFSSFCSVLPLCMSMYLQPILLFQVWHLELRSFIAFSSFVSTFICMTLLLTKFNSVCYSNLPCQVLCFYFSLSPPHLIFCYLPLPTRSFPSFPSLEVESIL